MIRSSSRLDSPWVLLLIVAISYLPFITPLALLFMAMLLLQFTARSKKPTRAEQV
jgi:uncharacterized protein (DUF58 family)